MDKVEKIEAGKVPGSMTYVLSDSTVDRYGDIVEPAGWDLRWFKKNPIALFGHNAGFPIGNWKNPRVEGGKLIAELMPAQRGTSQRIDEIISLIEQDVLRATSVGFRPLDQEPIDKAQPFGGQRYKKSELLECSIVSVPANPAALHLAKSLNVSDETMSLVFGEQAVMRRRDIGQPGGNAATPPKTKGSTNMLTLSQRIEALQNEIVAKRDLLVELNSVEPVDLDAIDEVNNQIAQLKRELSSRKSSEEVIGTNAQSGAGASPAVLRRPLGIGPQREVSGLDLMVRRALVFACSAFGNKSVESVLDERYPGHEATSVIAKADQTIGTTTVSGWATELMQTSYQQFIDALRPMSIYPVLRDRGMGINFDKAGTAYIPGLTAGGANGSFFGEGSPIRVGRITTNSTTMTVKKMGVIIPFSREAARRSTPSLEQLVRRAIVDDTAATLDSLLLDATAVSSIRPAGLLNGVSATASGYGGGDYQAVIADINALVAPFDTANASDNIVLIMHPAQARKLAMMPGPDGSQFGWANQFLSEFTVVKSTSATSGRLIAVRASDFATALGDAPDFEVSNQATVHMEDATPLEIVSGTGPTTADPVRSFWQTDTMGVRMVMEVNWKMLRSGMVSWIDTTTW